MSYVYFLPGFAFKIQKYYFYYYYLTYTFTIFNDTFSDDSSDSLRGRPAQRP